MRTTSRILLQALRDERRDFRRELCPSLGYRPWRFRKVGGDEAMRRVALERRLSRQHLVGQAPECIDVRPVIRAWITGGLLWGHVRRRADAYPSLRQRFEPAVPTRCGERLRDPEIGDDRRAARKENISRFDVAMDDASLMRVGERSGDIAKEAHALTDWQDAVAGKPVAEGSSLDERHRVVGVPRGPTGGEQRNDVRLLQRGRELDLALEAFRVDPLGQLGVQYLDDDRTPESALVSEEHTGHSSAAELAVEGVGGAER